MFSRCSIQPLSLLARLPATPQSLQQTALCSRMNKTTSNSETAACVYKTTNPRRASASESWHHANAHKHEQQRDAAGLCANHISTAVNTRSSKVSLKLWPVQKETESSENTCHTYIQTGKHRLKWRVNIKNDEFSKQKEKRLCPNDGQRHKKWLFYHYSNNRDESQEAKFAAWTLQ